jgi:hypothetical protein
MEERKGKEILLLKKTVIGISIGIGCMLPNRCRIVAGKNPREKKK